MTRRFPTLCLLLLSLLVAFAAQAEPSPAAFADVDVDTLDIDWQASELLMFLPVTTSLEPGAHEAQVRIHEGGQPVFFERISFEIDGKPAVQARVAPAPLGLQILSDHREERAWLLERSAAGAGLGVEVQIDGGLVFKDAFSQLLAQSDQLRQGLLRPVGATDKFLDLRPEPAQKNFCVDDCYDEYSECQVDFCYWDYDEYMCNQGCDLELDDCLTYADPVCEPPTCTPGVVTTDTDTVLIGSQSQGFSCLRDLFYDPNDPFASVYYNFLQLTYQTTTRELRRNADCSTVWVTTGTSTSTTSCYSYTSIPCSFGFAYPSCLI